MFLYVVSWHTPVSNSWFRAELDLKVNCPALIPVCVCVRTAVYLSSCERWLGTHNRHARSAQHQIAVVNYRPKLPQSLRVAAVSQSRIVLLTVPF